MYDDRGPSSPNPSERDLFLGVRVTMNDKDDTSALVAIITDVVSGETLYTLQASRRFGDSVTVSLEGSGFPNVQPLSPFQIMGPTAELDPDYKYAPYAKQSFLQLEIAYYF